MLCQVPPIQIGAACQPRTGREGLAALAKLGSGDGALDQPLPDVATTFWVQPIFRGQTIWCQASS